MLARRIIAVSPDEAFGQQLEAGLVAVAGTVDVHQTIDALGTGELPALCVIHLDGELARAASERLPRLAGAWSVRRDTAPGLAAWVSVPARRGVMVAEGFDPRRLSAMAARILTDDLFGFENMMAPGTPIHARVVGDYQEKSRCMSEVSEFVDEAKVPRKYRAPIEQCIDEMVMNALYDAPVDAQGNHLFPGI